MGFVFGFGKILGFVLIVDVGLVLIFLFFVVWIVCLMFDFLWVFFKLLELLKFDFLWVFFKFMDILFELLKFDFLNVFFMLLDIIFGIVL